MIPNRPCRQPRHNDAGTCAKDEGCQTGMERYEKDGSPLTKVNKGRARAHCLFRHPYPFSTTAWTPGWPPRMFSCPRGILCADYNLPMPSNVAQTNTMARALKQVAHKDDERGRGQAHSSSKDCGSASGHFEYKEHYKRRISWCGWTKMCVSDVIGGPKWFMRSSPALNATPLFPASPARQRHSQYSTSRTHRRICHLGP